MSMRTDRNAGAKGRWTASAGLALWLAAGCASAPSTPPSPKAFAVKEAPAELAPRLASADAAMAALQKRLGSRLQEELGRGGPPAAVQVCRQEAQALTREVAVQQGIEVGRTSHRLRNPTNAPRDWARPYVEAAAGKKAAEVAPVVVDLGDRIGLLRPIPTGAVCTQCHGAPEALAPEVSKGLAEAYPADRAVGFKEGDLRGFFWAEVRK